MSPLKITFRFASPVVVDSEYPINLDALLAWSRVREAEEAKDTLPWLLQDDLPLDKAGAGDDWVWKASQLLFSAAAPRQLVNQQRKCDPDRFYRDFQNKHWKAMRGDNAPTINPLSGQFRAYQFYVSTQWMARAEAWCIGNIDRVKALISRIDHVGKMGRNGFGLIKSIDVEIDPAASEQWKLRALPADVAGAPGMQYFDSLSPPRAPYWEEQRRVRMREPVIL